MQQTRTTQHPFIITCMALLAVLITSGLGLAAASRIVVVPHYSEEGIDSRDGGDMTRHYRRIIGLINNHLNKDFEVVNPAATELKEEYYNQIQDKSREFSPLSAKEMCRKYGTDLVYVVWLDVKLEITPDNFCKASARIEGEGYDSAGRDLGVALSKQIKIAATNCDDAVVNAEKEAADLVGRKLTAWYRDNTGHAAEVPVAQATVARSAADKTTGFGEQYEGNLEVRLDMVSEYPLVEVFGKVLNSVRGVTAAKTYRIRVEPEAPQAGYAQWRLAYSGTDPFRLQANIMTMLKKISRANGKLTLKGIAYRYTPDEVILLKGIRPADATSDSLLFTVDTELVRDKAMAAGHAVKHGGRAANHGFD